MAEYIDRDALEIGLNHRLNFLMAENGEYDSYTNGFEECVCRIEDFCAADVVPVVRCWECRSYNKPRLGWCSHHMDRAHPDDFCSYGERDDAE